MTVARVGRPTELSQFEEEVLTRTIQTITQWGFGMTKQLLQDFVFLYLESNGHGIERFASNRPGTDWVNSFMTRHNLVLRQTCNIKRSRASLRSVNRFETVYEFFNELRHCGLSEASPSHIFNYDETALSDNPGFQKRLEKEEHAVSKSFKNIQRPTLFLCSAVPLKENFFHPMSPTNRKVFTKLGRKVHHVALNSTAPQVAGSTKTFSLLGFVAL